jgi:hypothetical protein
MLASRAACSAHCLTRSWPSAPLQITRAELEQWVAQPFFADDALNGCVVRMAYGPGVRDAAGSAHPGYMIMEVRRVAVMNEDTC